MAADEGRKVAAQTVMAEPQGRTRRDVAVLSVPSDHVYVRHLAPLPGEDDGPRRVVRLEDPEDPWWPPPALEPAWLEARTDDFDIFHVHFGFDARSLVDLADVVDVLRSAGKPLVQTVHDLRNPHHTTRALHDAHLDVLVPAADVLITLTPGAAAEVAERWGCTALVLPHPHVVELDELRRRQARPVGNRNLFTVGLHLKSLRPCMSGVPVLDALLDATDALDGTRLRVDVHRDVVDPSGARHDPELVPALHRARDRGAQVEVHDYFDDDALWDYLEGLDASVLPYRYGTHSGWLEACRDLGTAVIAPDCGYYAEQGPVHSFHLQESGLDAASLVEAVRRAQAAGRPDPVPIQLREEQRRQVANAHATIYADLLR